MRSYTEIYREIEHGAICPHSSDIIVAKIIAAAVVYFADSIRIGTYGDDA